MFAHLLSTYRENFARDLSESPILSFLSLMVGFAGKLRVISSFKYRDFSAHGLRRGCILHTQKNKTTTLMVFEFGEALV